MTVNRSGISANKMQLPDLQTSHRGGQWILLDITVIVPAAVVVVVVITSTKHPGHCELSVISTLHFICFDKPKDLNHK